MQNERSAKIVAGVEPKIVYIFIFNSPIIIYTGGK